jgi:hypothetical protein
MNISESAPVAVGPGDERPASVPVADSEVASRASVIEAKLRARIQKWANDIGYWGEATTAVVGETIATDYSPPQTTATFRLGPLSFHCVQNDETDEFRVRLEGSRISNIPDLDTLHRAVRESEYSSTRPEQ